ncbi:hypothetical protein H6F98_27015 [Microcoleus sp. FACHB-SPT15]|uniref:hypothetical protein n=1 Tax=Microcoleus sp. FACHB-SPT15 TaxID=2692830 RepID=UPI0017865923|nr:hypothetical protein [Microcoleus sp. FACHB-SPT15]MBD1809078.1 hypothetical protein [Microcoleus sp. FACHB-SPT15]
MNFSSIKLNVTLVERKVIVRWKNPDWGTLPPKPPTGGRSASPRPPAQMVVGVMNFLKSVPFVLS